MNEIRPAEPEPAGPTAIRLFPELDPLTRYSILAIALLLLVGFLYLARNFLLPISIAILLSLVLNPIVRWLRRRGIPAPISASALVGGMLLAFVFVGYLLSGPIAAVVADAPRITSVAQDKFAILRGPVEALSRASQRVTEIVSPENDQNVVVTEGDSGAVLGYLAADASQRIAATIFSMVLLLFILASGDMFLEKVIKVLPTLSDKKLALRIARDVEHEVSRYFLTVALINIFLGILVGLAFWLLEMPSPFLWGAATTVANFLPYIGAAAVAIATFGVAVISYDSLAATMLPVLTFVALTALEGQVFTPLILGRRHTLNAVVVLASIAFWGWIWGVVGALIAVPLLVTVKVFADHVEKFSTLGEFLSGRNPAPSEETTEHG
jgi:predicted PurR-regulated permease PerM